MPALRWLGRGLAAALILGGVVAATAFVRTGRPEFFCTDFSPVHSALRAFWRGVDVYDPVALTPYVLETCPRGTTHLGYPPWFVLGLAGLGLFEHAQAARLWVLANLVMVAATVHVLTVAWAPRRRALAICAAIAYVPTLLLVGVGQFAMPVALGAALLATGARLGHPAMGGAGLVLMAFKPHVGLAVVAPALTALGYRARSILLRGAVGGAALALASFAVSATWPADYLSAALRLMGDSRNVACDTCASIVSTAARDLPAWTRHALTLSILAGAGVLLRGRDRAVTVGGSVLAALLALPYVRSYDYALMIVPLVIAWERGGAWARALLVAAWALPVLVFTTSRQAGVYPLMVAAALVFAVLLYAPGRPASAEPSWNVT